MMLSSQLSLTRIHIPEVIEMDATFDSVAHVRVQEDALSDDDPEDDRRAPKQRDLDPPRAQASRPRLMSTTDSMTILMACRQYTTREVPKLG